MRKSLTILLTSFLALGMFSCGEDLSTNVVNTDENPSLYQPMPTYSVADGVMGTVQFLYSPTAFPQDNPILMKAGFARFGRFTLPGLPGADSLADAGNVTVNNYGLRKFRYDSSLTYSSFSHRHPAVLTSVEFDGSLHTFSATGTTFIPAFTLPVQSPVDFAVGFPIRNGIVRRDTGLYVEWGGGSNDSPNKILLRVTSPDTSHVLRLEGLRDRGFYRIDEDDLRPFTGKITLDIVKYRDTTATFEGRSYTAFSQIVKSVPVTLF